MATATVASILTSMRYDLRDSDARQFVDDELVDYINRGLTILDSTLAAKQSDWVHKTDDSFTLASGSNEESYPTDFKTVRSIWEDSNQIVKKDVDYIYYQRKFITTGRPYCFAIEDTNFIFDYTADQEYTLTVHYNKKSTALTTSGNMPFNDDFNLVLQQGAVLFAKNRNNKELNIDAVIGSMFEEAANKNVLKRNFVPKNYRLDF
jgi:hypothetical protein